MTNLKSRTHALRTDDGDMNVYETFPEGRGPLPPAILFADAGGLRDAIRHMADRLARGGRHVLVPDLYHRHGDVAPFDMKTVFDDQKERNRLMSLARSVTADQAMSDARACLAHAAALPNVDGRAFFVGYCLGGRLAFVAADRFGDRVAAAASIHGGYLVTDKGDSPHKHISGIRARLYFAVADDDETCTPENVTALRGELDGARIEYTVEKYDGCRHGFAVPDTKVHDHDAADRHWKRVEELFTAASQPAT